MKLAILVESARDIDIDFQFTGYTCLYIAAIIIAADVYCSRKLL